MKIKKKTAFRYTGKVNDLSVENTSSYNVEGLGVHNSAAGCLISYLIGITGIDPIPYNLLFSRFYNAGRKGTLPDIDLDVPTEHRDEIIAYIKMKYGEDKVSQMATFSALMGRSAIKEVLRIEDNVSFAEANDITEIIPDKAEIADELENMEDPSIIKWALINRAKALSEWCTMDEHGNLSGPLASSFHKAIQIEGCYKAQSTHAAGVIISKRPLADICPIVRDKDGKPIAGLEMGDLEALGHVKFDILGVNILDKLMDIIPFLPEGCDIENLEDEKVWNLLSEGDVKGIFQLEKQKRWAKRLKPRNIHHLAALVSIIRPGVVEAIEDEKSMTQHYIDRKNGEEPVPVIDPVVDVVLKDTYGVLVYQETAMLLARAIADFTLNEADELRKAIGKKLTSVMAKVKNKFFIGAEYAKKVSQEVYTKMFDWIEKSQRYSFNASHAYSYAHNAYYSAYCKTHAPLKFYEVYLNHAKNKPDNLQEVNELVNDARKNRIEILPPTLTNFHSDFTMLPEKNAIVYGFSHIKNVGKTEAKKINDIANSGINLKKLSWVEILCIFQKINSRAMEALISTGALNNEENMNSRDQMFYEYNTFKGLTDKEIDFIKDNIDKTKDLQYHINLLINKHKISSSRLAKVISIKSALENPMYDTKDSSSMILQRERYYLGVPLSFLANGSCDMSQADTSCLDVIMGNVKGTINIVVNIKSVKEHKVKAGKTVGQMMAFITGEDSSGCLNTITVFPKEYQEYKNIIVANNNVFINGVVDSRNGEYSLNVKKIIQI